jgi:hypothetical protein
MLPCLIAEKLCHSHTTAVKQDEHGSDPLMDTASKVELELTPFHRRLIVLAQGVQGVRLIAAMPPRSDGNNAPRLKCEQRFKKSHP